MPKCGSHDQEGPSTKMGLRKGDFMDRYIAITKRVPKPDRHRDKDNLWTEIWPSQVHITDRDLNPNRHRNKDQL